MARKYFLIALSIFPKYLTTVQSFSFNDYQLNNFSDKLLISGWYPLSDKNIKDKKASDKTIQALNEFKNMSSLKHYFKKLEVIIFSQI